MLKNILKIEGVQELNKIEQTSLKGGYVKSEACRQLQGMCCHTFPSGFENCDAGRCTRTGCVWF